MTSKKILFIDQYNKIGGGQSVLLDLINQARHLSYDVTVAIPKGGYIENNVKNCHFIYLPELNLNNGTKSIKDIAKMILHYFKILFILNQVKKNDIIYVNGSRYFIITYLFSFLSNKKYIYHIHLNFKGGTKKLLTQIFKRANTVKMVFTSHFVLNNFTKNNDEIKKNGLNKVVVIEPGISMKYFDMPFKNIFANEKKEEVYNFICVGRIIPDKGFETFVELAKYYPLYNFYVVGDAEQDTLNYLRTLKETATQNVFFVGKSYDVPALFNSLNIHFSIIPSKWEEPFGIVATEAMACSCITFVSNRGGLCEIANNTGAIVFENIDSLRKELNIICLMDNHQKFNIANQQYTNNRKFYGKFNFENKLGNMLNSL